jgi:hypothetical protein
MTWNRAGKVMWPPTREIETKPSSSGWRSASSVERALVAAVVPARRLVADDGVACVRQRQSFEPGRLEVGGVVAAGSARREVLGSRPRQSDVH